MTKDFKFNPSVMPFYPSRNSCSDRILSNLSDKELQNDCNLEWNNVKKSPEISIFDQSQSSSDAQGDYTEMNLYHSLMTSPNIRNIWSRHAPDFPTDIHHSFDCNQTGATKAFEDNEAFTPKSNSRTSDPLFSDESPLDAITQDHVWTSLGRNEDRSISPGAKSDHNSTSYGSLQQNSFLSDILFARSESDHKIDDLPNICCHNRVHNACANCSSNVVDAEGTGAFHDAGYYSPFSTGMNLAFGSDDDDDCSRNQSYKSLFASSAKNSTKSLYEADKCLSKERSCEANVLCDDVFLGDVTGSFLRNFDEIDEKSHMRKWLGLPPTNSPVSKPNSKDVDLKDFIRNRSQNFPNFEFPIDGTHSDIGSNVCNKIHLNSTTCTPGVYRPFTQSPFSQLLTRDLMRLPAAVRQQYLEAALLNMDSKCSLLSFDNCQNSKNVDFNGSSCYNLPLQEGPCFQLNNNWHLGQNVCGVQQLPTNKNLSFFLRPNIFAGHPANHAFGHQIFGFPLSGYRPIRRSGPSNELHVRLEECYEQFKNIENERKRTEAELARQNPGKNVSSDNSKTIPAQLSQNPSRVDRLVVETMKEHSRVETLMGKMEHLRSMVVPRSVYAALSDWFEAACKVHSCRKDEIINAINRHQIKNPQQQKEKDVLALASSLEELSKKTRKARTALWVALQMASFDLPEACMKAAYTMASREVVSKVRSGPVPDEVSAKTVEPEIKEAANDEDSDWFE